VGPVEGALEIELGLLLPGEVQEGGREVAEQFRHGRLPIDLHPRRAGVSGAAVVLVPVPIAQDDSLLPGEGLRLVAAALVPCLILGEIRPQAVSAVPVEAGEDLKAHAGSHPADGISTSPTRGVGSGVHALLVIIIWR
jgi:hypothetical protein